MTAKQKLILFLISCDPGIRSIYKMVQIYDRADFPSKMTENLDPLLNDNLIFVSENFNNGTPSTYSITEKGKEFLKNNFVDTEVIEFIKTMQNPELLLQITEACIARKNGL
jgi:DNA-binding MarR family transcriptional regulator